DKARLDVHDRRLINPETDGIEVRRHRGIVFGLIGFTSIRSGVAVLPQVQLGVSYDHHRWVPMRSGSLGKLRATDRYASVLVSRMPVHWRGQWNGECLLQNGFLWRHG